MKRIAPRLVTVAVIVCLALVGLAACSDFGPMVRKVTYPPDFKYVSGEELRSKMDKLAYQVQRLDTQLAAGDKADQQQVLAILREIKQVGEDLQAGPGGSNHPFLEDHMGDFVSKVGKARLSAAQNPPRYYLAGQVSGACVSCHKVTR